MRRLRLRHALTGHVYEFCDDALVHVINHHDEVSKFKPDGAWVEGPMTHCDTNMCNWIGGRQLPGANVVPLNPPPKVPKVPKDKNLRQLMAEPVRESFREAIGEEVDVVCDAELLDSIYLTLICASSTLRYSCIGQRPVTGWKVAGRPTAPATFPVLPSWI